MAQEPLPRQQDVDPDHLVPMGGPVQQATVSMRVFGETLEPGEITRRLGCQPSAAHKKGDLLSQKHHNRVAQTGSWLLKSPLPETTELETQVVALLALVTDDLSTWARLSEEFRIDVYCGLFLTDGNRGFSLSPRATKLLADRGIAIGFDIYCL